MSLFSMAVCNSHCQTSKYHQVMFTKILFLSSVEKHNSKNPHSKILREQAAKKSFVF